MGLHLGIGLGLSFSYILFQTITSTFAINGNVPPAIAVWIPNILMQASHSICIRKHLNKET